MSMRPELLTDVVAVERTSMPALQRSTLMSPLLTIVVPPSPMAWIPTVAQGLGPPNTGGAEVVPMSMSPELSMTIAPPSYSMSSEL